MDENRSESKKPLLTKESLTFFKTQEDFREWLEKHSEKESELLVGFYKVGSGKPSMSWSQSVDQALCFGWIDGIRRSVDDESYCIRFSPRRINSVWSAINIKKVEELTIAGLMKPAGIKIFNDRNLDKCEVYSYEKEQIIIDSKYESIFRENNIAWDFFMKQAPSYKKAVLRWIMSGKQEDTRLSRLEKTIKASEQLKRVT